MKIKETIEKALVSVKIGDKQSEKKIYTLLTARFRTIVSQELRACTVLCEKSNMNQLCGIISKRAIAHIEKYYPPSGNRFSIIRAVFVLRNVIDDVIANELTNLAKKGDREAEAFLFILLRKKLFERVVKKRWGSLEK